MSHQAERQALPDPKKSYTVNYQHHVPCGFKFTVIDYKREIFNAIIYRGEDVVAMFNHYLKETADELVKIIKTVRPMIITEEQEREFQTATLCYMCDKEFGEDRVRDHCHCTGYYWGPAHNACNLHCNRKASRYPPFYTTSRTTTRTSSSARPTPTRRKP